MFSPQSPQFSQSTPDSGQFGTTSLFFSSAQTPPTPFLYATYNTTQWDIPQQGLSPSAPFTQDVDPHSVTATYAAYQQQQQQQEQQEQQQQLNELRKEDSLTRPPVGQPRAQEMYRRDVVSFIETLGDFLRGQSDEPPRDKLLGDKECDEAAANLRAVLDMHGSRTDSDDDDDDDDEGAGTPRNALTPTACQELFDTFLCDSEEYLLRQGEQQPTGKRQREHTDMVCSEIVDVADKRMRASGDWNGLAPADSAASACASPLVVAAMDDIAGAYSSSINSGSSDDDSAARRADAWLQTLAVPTREERQDALGARERGAPAWADAPKAEDGRGLLSGPCAAWDAAAPARAELARWRAEARRNPDARALPVLRAPAAEGVRQALLWLVCDARGRLDAARWAQLAGLLYCGAPFAGRPVFAVGDLEALLAWPGFLGFCPQTRLAAVLRARPEPCCSACALLPETSPHGVLTVAWKRPGRAGRARLAMDHIAMLRADQDVRLHADATHAATLRAVGRHVLRTADPARAGLAAAWTEPHPGCHGFYSVASGRVFTLFPSLRALLQRIAIAFPPISRPAPFLSSLPLPDGGGDGGDEEDDSGTMR